MKRWIAGLLAAVFLLAGGTGWAENDLDESTVIIQDSVISPEAETSNTLTDNLKLVLQLLRNEDVLSLFQFEDVKDLTNEVVLKVLVWMLQNRPVTMKILAELGIGERDLRCIGKIWDSADRIRNTLRTYMETEKGKQLARELKALKNDPELKQSANHFLTMITSTDAAALLKDISKIMRESPETTETEGDGELIQEAARRNMNRNNVTGTLIMGLASLVEKSDWARESLPQLVNNDNLWKVLNHITNIAELDAVIREEILRLSGDKEVMGFVHSTLLGVANLLMGTGKEKPEETSEVSRPAGGEAKP